MAEAAGAGGMRELREGEPGTIGPYRIVGVLGAGGMGRVFLGLGPDGRLAAIKQILELFAEDQEFRQRFVREVDSSRRVSGAYTAAVMDADPDAELPWLASVYVPGPALGAVVPPHGALPPPSIQVLAVGLVIALREIHRVGLIHRDLKPSNVLLAEDGPRVIDFGIAHAVSESANRLTETGSMIGSPGFMSPEQVEGLPLTPASDMFSLGALLTPDADASIGFIANLVGPTSDVPTNQRILDCEYVAVEDIVIRGCATVANDIQSFPGGQDVSEFKDDDARAAVRAFLAPLVSQARAAQDG